MLSVVRVAAATFRAALVVAFIGVAAGLVGCSGATNAPTTSITFPAADRPVDLTVHVRTNVTFEQVEQPIKGLTLRPGSAIEGYRINFDALTVFLYLRSDSTPAERQRLQEMLLQLSIVTGVEP